MVSKLEFLCDAIAEYSGSHDPRSEAYRFRNPLGLREKEVIRDQEGNLVSIKFGQLRHFRSWVHGYEAALFDLKVKCSGRNRGLSQGSSIAELLTAYGMNGQSAHNVANYLKFALEDDGITQETQLSVFLR